MILAQKPLSGLLPALAIQLPSPKHHETLPTNEGLDEMTVNPSLVSRKCEYMFQIEILSLKKLNYNTLLVRLLHSGRKGFGSCPDPARFKLIGVPAFEWVRVARSGRFGRIR